MGPLLCCNLLGIIQMKSPISPILSWRVGWGQITTPNPPPPLGGHCSLHTNAGCKSRKCWYSQTLLTNSHPFSCHPFTAYHHQVAPGSKTVSELGPILFTSSGALQLLIVWLLSPGWEETFLRMSFLCSIYHLQRVWWSRWSEKGEKFGKGPPYVTLSISQRKRPLPPNPVLGKFQFTERFPSKEAHLFFCYSSASSVGEQDCSYFLQTPWAPFLPAHLCDYGGHRRQIENCSLYHSANWMKQSKYC